MRYIMIHPKYGYEMEVNPNKVKRLLREGWKQKTEPSTEVIEFDKNKTADFIQSKKAGMGLGFPTSITEVVPPVAQVTKIESEPEKVEAEPTQQDDPIDEEKTVKNKGGRPPKQK